ncbi:hypothetical protein UPYG_G00269050 [Umbra pygmaea]|uniref:M-phase phosphoprotein 6 n=1 Tax=Umbra pygmaea TaxID=75934 RepID=A0ABD0WUS5_UMBPY
MAIDNAKLSKNLLRMKFMQRGLDADTKKQLEEGEKRIISDEHWYLDLPELKAKENFITEEMSFGPFEDLKYGRMSFKGFNPEVEKLMILMNAPNEEEEEEEEISRMETDITDEDMARRYESLVGTMKKRFAKKRQRMAEVTKDDVAAAADDDDAIEKKTKRAFLKPKD